MFRIQAKHFHEWRDKTRSLLERKVSPEAVIWNTTEQQSLFESELQNIEDLEVRVANIRVPQEFLSLAKNVACFRNDQRWALMYALVWRLVFENRQLLSNKTDDQVKKFLAMNKAVNRDRHKMKAFVRFKEIRDSSNKIRFVSWFEPSHLIVPSTADFFVRRFTSMSWSILTPDHCAHWDGGNLHITEGIQKPGELVDNIERLWLEYYRSIFNPARLKLKAMQAEMPKKYWKNLPEAELIGHLSQTAQQRTYAMIQDPPAEGWSKTQKSSLVQAKQHSLREQSSATKEEVSVAYESSKD